MDRADRTIELSDKESLARKLTQFDASLTPAERALFRYRISSDIRDGDDVEGHAMEMRWSQGPEGMFRGWVEVDEDEVRTIDPRRWNTLSVSSSVDEHSVARGRQPESTA